MESLKKTEDIVKRLLETYPETRSSDDVLYARVCEYVCKTVGELPFPVVLMHRKKLGIPSYKSVERSRRKLQGAFPELCANADIEAFRKVEEEKYKNYGKKVSLWD